MSHNVPVGRLLPLQSSAGPGVSEERIAATPCDESARPTGLAKRGYLTVEMESQARRAPRQRPPPPTPPPAQVGLESLK